MKHNIFKYLLFVFILISCEDTDLLKEDVYSQDICKDCTTIIIEDNIITDRITGFYCGESLTKQENANFTELINGKIRETKTVCIKQNTKAK